MRTEAEVMAEIAALGCPMAVAAELRSPRADLAAWKSANPEKAARRTALLAEAQAIEDAEGLARQREEDRQRALKRLTTVVGSKIASVLMALDEFHPAIVTARRWDSSALWSLVLYGTVGAGKSVAAGWLARRAIDRGEDVLWLRALEIATTSSFGVEAQSLKQQARTTGLLVIDDVGAESESGAWKAWLEDVLGARYASNRRTVLTTNLDAGGLKGRLGARLTDRLRAGANYGLSRESMRKPGVLP